MKKFDKKTIYRLKRSWEIAVIILVNIMMITAAVSFIPSDNNFDASSSVEVLSKIGSRGDEVRRVQQKLKTLGLYTGAVDGIYGQKTASAVKQFQRNCGITADGIAGPKTLLYLGLGGGSSGGGGGGGQYSNSDVYLIARVISAEARGEPYKGQVAVGAVILNRVKHASFPDSVAGVVYQPGAFTCITDSNWSQPVADSARKAAQDCINGWDPSGGAIYYYAPAKTSNRWIKARPVITTIGTHIFCR